MAVGGGALLGGLFLLVLPHALVLLDIGLSSGAVLPQYLLAMLLHPLPVLLPLAL